MDMTIMRKHYKRADLGKGVRGKYYAEYQRGTNLALLRPEVAAVFPTSEDVNEALLGLMKLARTARPGARSAARGRDKPTRSDRS